MKIHRNTHTKKVFLYWYKFPHEKFFYFYLFFLNLFKQVWYHISSLWHHLILLDSIDILNTLSFSVKQVMFFLEFHIIMTCSRYGICFVSSVLCPTLVTSFITFPKISLPHDRSSIPCSVTSNSLVIFGKEHILFQYNLTFVAAFQTFSNSNYPETVYITELELQIQNRNPISFLFFTFQQNKIFSEFLEKIFALLSCICDFNWFNL